MQFWHITKMKTKLLWKLLSKTLLNVELDTLFDIQKTWKVWHYDRVLLHPFPCIVNISINSEHNTATIESFYIEESVIVKNNYKKGNMTEKRFFRRTLS